MAIWHHKEARWNYYLDVNGRSVSKRYTVDDLARVGAESSAADPLDES